MTKSPEIIDLPKVRFWAVLAVMILLVCIAVSMIDLSIKAAIIEESNNLRLFMESIRNGQRTEGTDKSGANTNSTDDPAVSGDVLAFNPPGMETRNVHKRATPRTKTRPDTEGDPIG